ncbi:hypothetical protein QFC22_002071 [Naganishia vaughanmartiniae]|uniref:Uncharacterized protein n=1 Tax=Naganishia vaughanmartiniae TaxID=1424756 RepID=A0ACC2XDL0_9TREE|nr:hypothetical protein QFC22_002071 [Naganishia vaughanmartiniae]
MDTSQPSQQPSSLKSRLEAFQTPSSSSSANNDSQRPRVASGSLKDRIALFNANAESSKPLIPTAAFGTSAPPPGGPISRTTGGGMIGNRLPKLDPSSAGMLSRNIAQPVAGARKVSENRGLYGTRIPSVTKQHTGGSTTSVASSDVGRQQVKDASTDIEAKDAQPETLFTVPEPRQPLSTSADLEEDAVDLKDAPFEARGFAVGARGRVEDTASLPPATDIPVIRAEDLVPSTLPHDDDDENNVSSDISEPPSPRSTAAQGSETTPSISGFSDRSSIPAISRINSSLSVATTAQSSGTLNSLRVETGGPEEEAERLRVTAQQVAEDQDNLSEVSTPTGTPTIQPRDHLPEIPGSLNATLGGLSLHPDGTVTPGVFGTAKKMPSLGKHEDQVMVDTSALPAETSKLTHEQRTHERNPDATETEMNKKGTESQSDAAANAADDKMVHIELSADDPALTEEGRELQKLAKKKLADEANARGVSEWQVMQEDAKDRPQSVKQEQANANEKETGDRDTSFDELRAQTSEQDGREAAPTDSGFAVNMQDETTPTSVESKDFASAGKSVDMAAATVGDDKSEAATDASKANQEEGVVEDMDATSPTGLQPETPTEVIEPATPLAETEETVIEPTNQVDSTTSPTVDRDESTTVEDITGAKAVTTEGDDIQDIEDIPTSDDTELHKKDQDPNLDSLIVGKHNGASGGVKPKVEITEEDTVEDENESNGGSFAQKQDQSKQGDDATQVEDEDKDMVLQTPSSVPSQVEETLECPAKSDDNVASATFPSVPKQDPEIHGVSNTQTPEPASRTSTPAREDVILPSVPKEDVDREDSAQGKVRVEVTLSPGKHLASPMHQALAADKSESKALDKDMNRFLAKADQGGIESGDAQAQDTALVDAAKLAKSTSSSSTLSSTSSTSSKKKKSIERGRSPLLDMDTDGEDDGEAGWAKVSVNKTKYT